MIAPNHTIFLLVASGALAGILYWRFAQTAIQRADLRFKSVWQIGVTVFLAVIYLLAFSFSLNRVYTQGGASTGSLIPLLVGVMVGVNVLLFVVSRGYRQMVSAIPLLWLIASHALRVIPGIIFLALHDMGLMPPNTALQAGYGDILSGLFALVVVYMLYRKTPYARSAALVWGIFGLLDLVNALYSGQTNIPGWTLMLTSAGQSVDIINFFVMLPTFMVPLYIVSQLLIFRKLAALKINDTLTRFETSSQPNVWDSDSRPSHQKS